MKYRKSVRQLPVIRINSKGVHIRYIHERGVLHGYGATYQEAVASAGESLAAIDKYLSEITFIEDAHPWWKFWKRL